MSSLKTVGSRAQVMHGNAKKTSGGLTKSQLKYNKQGRIVSRKASALAKKNNRLVNAGYITRKGVFGGGKMMKGGGCIFSRCLGSNNNKESIEPLLNNTSNENSHENCSCDPILVSTIKRAFTPTELTHLRITNNATSLPSEILEKLRKIGIDSKANGKLGIVSNANGNSSTHPTSDVRERDTRTRLNPGNNPISLQQLLNRQTNRPHTTTHQIPHSRQTHDVMRRGFPESVQRRSNEPKEPKISNRPTEHKRSKEPKISKGPPSSGKNVGFNKEYQRSRMSKEKSLS
jgi:hypothetical protein